MTLQITLYINDYPYRFFSNIDDAKHSLKVCTIITKNNKVELKHNKYNNDGTIACATITTYEINDDTFDDDIIFDTTKSIEMQIKELEHVGDAAASTQQYNKFSCETNDQYSEQKTPIRPDESMIKYKSNLSSYKKIKNHMLSNVINTVPILFQDKYPVFEFMNDKKLLADSNASTIYNQLHLIIESNDHNKLNANSNNESDPINKIDDKYIDLCDEFVLYLGENIPCSESVIHEQLNNENQINFDPKN